MLFCPNCKYEYVSGLVYCPDCNESLVSEKYLKRIENRGDDVWTVIYTSDKEYEIQMLIDNLRSGNIEAISLSQKDRNYPIPGELSVINLLVKEKDCKESISYINNVINGK